jgi:hypothetical protein
METIMYEDGLSNMAPDGVYNYEQLTKAKKFLSDISSALMLKNALISWNENHTMPDSIA